MFGLFALGAGRAAACVSDADCTAAQYCNSTNAQCETRYCQVDLNCSSPDSCCGPQVATTVAGKAITQGKCQTDCSAVTGSGSVAPGTNCSALGGGGTAGAGCWSCNPNCPDAAGACAQGVWDCFTCRVALPACPGSGQPPHVNIDVPNMGSTVVAGVSTRVEGWYEAYGGKTISTIEIYANGSLIGQSAINQAGPARWGMDWIPPANLAGSVTLTAKAIDSAGGQKVSNPVTITVQDTPPHVNIDVPGSASTVPPGKSTRVEGWYEAYGGKTVSTIHVYANGALIAQLSIGQTGAARWGFDWTPASAGPVSLTAVATDSGGVQTTSNPVNITVGNSPPFVNMDVPAGNSNYLTGQSVRMEGWYQDSDGIVLHVDLYYNGVNFIDRVAVNSAGSARWGYDWTLPAGLLNWVELKAIAVDDALAQTESSPVFILVRSPDTTPPARFNAYPATSLPAGTLSVDMRMETDEKANCRIDLVPGTPYTSMPFQFMNTDGTQHSVTLSPLYDGYNQAFYVRCRDDAGNVNPDDFPITVNVSASSDVTPPVRFNHQPTQPYPAGTTQATMTLETDETAHCAIALVPGILHGDMPFQFAATNATAHSVSFPVSNGFNQTFYVRCVDIWGNSNDFSSPADYPITVSVLGGGTGAAPTLTTLTPRSAAAGGPDFTLRLDGADFIDGAKVMWNGTERTTTFVSDTQLTAAIPAADIAVAGTALVSVLNPDNQSSAVMSFMIGLAPTPGLVAAYGVQTQADLTILSPKSNTFSHRLCEVMNPGNCGDPGLTWTIADDGSGNVADPGNGAMNGQGWYFAKQFVEISNVDTNMPGWVLHLYTDNRSGNPVAYSGPLVTPAGQVQGAVGGLVSEDGQFLVPLSWRLFDQPIPASGSLSVSPAADRIEPVPDSCSNRTIDTGRFDDFATHYLSDLNDVDTHPANLFQPTWWQKVSSPCNKRLAKNYQSPLSADGAALAEFYRTPYSTLTGIGTYPLYIAGKFAPGTIKSRYRTTLFMEIVSQ